LQALREREIIAARPN